MNAFRKLFKDKDKKSIFYVFALCAASILLLMLSLTFGKPKSGVEGSATEKLFLQNANTPENTPNATTTSHLDSSEYEKAIEQKLQDILAYVDGAGKVQVMVTFSNGKEIIVAEDETIDESTTTETDSQGGSREVYNNKQTEETLLVKTKDGTELPIVITEMNPKVEGVLIVAQGGGDILVKDSLVRAAQIVLGIAPHKVQVLKMK